MDLTDIRDLYRDREGYIGKEVTVGGWVRSNRDSKTFGFLVLNDGTYFETLQVVYHDKMANFEELAKLNVGSAIVVKGTIVATPEAKQPFEMQAAEAFVEDDSASSCKNQHVSGSIQGAFPCGIRHSLFLYGERFCLCAYAYYYRQRLRGRRRNVSGYNHGHGQTAQNRRGCVGLRTGFLWKAY